MISLTLPVVLRKALDNLAEALYLFLRSCFERGMLGQVLKEAGLRPASLQSHFPKYQETVTVELLAVC